MTKNGENDAILRNGTCAYEKNPGTLHMGETMDAISIKKPNELSDSEDYGTGRELLNKVVELTGLDDNEIHAELDKILHDAGHADGEITLEELRTAMIAYLESFKPDLVSDESGLLGD